MNTVSEKDQQPCTIAGVSCWAVNYEGRELLVSKSDKCERNGFGDCHCNHCIDSIIEMDGIRKQVYFAPHLNHKVRVTKLYPFKNCADCFIEHIDWPNNTSGQGYGFCSVNDLEPCI